MCDFLRRHEYAYEGVVWSLASLGIAQRMVWYRELVWLGHKRIKTASEYGVYWSNATKELTIQ